MSKRVKQDEGRFVVTEIIFAEGKFDPDAEFEIMTTAKQTDSRYGDFQYKKEELEEMAKNFNDNIVGVDIALDLNHDGQTIALGWLKPGSMSVSASTKLKGESSLFVKLYKFTPKGKELLETGAVKYFSIELQFKFNKFVNGVKKLFKNVIRGLALTNTPLVKDMSPTFSESKLSNPFTMEDLKKLFDSLTANDSITDKQLSEFKEEAAKVIETDADLKEEVSKMETTLTEKKEKADKKLADEKAKKLADDAAEKILKEKGKKSYSEAEVKAIAAEIANEAIKKPMKQLNEMYVEGRNLQLSTKVESLCLSEDQNIGFKADSKGKILEFVKKLSDELASEYFEIHKDIIAAVDLKEYGRDGIVEEVGKNEVLKELAEKAEKKMKENEKLSYGDATKEVLDEDKELAEKIEKMEEESE